MSISRRRTAQKDPVIADRIGEHMRALQRVVHYIRDATTGTGGSGRATGSGSDHRDRRSAWQCSVST